MYGLNRKKRGPGAREKPIANKQRQIYPKLDRRRKFARAQSTVSTRRDHLHVGSAMWEPPVVDMKDPSAPTVIVKVRENDWL